MKKRKILIGVVLAGVALGLASCTTDKPAQSTTTTAGDQTTTVTPTTGTTTVTPTTGTTTVTPTTGTTTVITPTTTTTVQNQPTTSNPADEERTANLFVHKDPSKFDEEVEPIVVELEKDGNEWYGMPEVDDPVDDYREFGGWYTDKDCTIAWNQSDGITEDTHIYAKWNETTTMADYRLHIDSNFSAGNVTNQSVNVFNIPYGTIRARNKSVTLPDGTVNSYVNSLQMNGSKSTFEFTAPKATTVLICGQNGSSSGNTRLLFTHADGTTQSLGFDDGVAKSGGYFTVEVPAGKTVVTSEAGTIDVFDVQFTCEVDLSPIDRIEMTGLGITDLIEGQTYAPAGLSANVVYENETTAALAVDNNASVEVNFDAVNTATPGTYTVEVTYNVTENLYGEEVNSSYKDTFDVTVYEFQEIVLGFNKTITGKNSYNSTYINDTVQRVYLAGNAYSDNALTVTAVTKNVADNSEKLFILPAADYTNDSETSFAAEGVQKNITYTYTTNGKTDTASYDVYVVTAAPSIVDGVAQVKVDGAYEGVIGEVVDGYNNFKTIQQALDYLELQYAAEAISGDILISLAAGTYKEKIEINLPNVTIQGAGKDTTKIEWDSLYGIEDESGYVQVTDSTQTVAVREAAENCTITGVTISNYWNSTSVFQEAFGKGYGEHRALALLVQSDKFIMDDCALLGYQDTVEFFTGRQLIQNTLITGTTDFIFGSNNTTYFYNCEIKSIVTEDSYKAGGYITAFKGANKGADDYVQYGAIFDACNFTAEEGVYTKGQVIVDEKGEPDLDENGAEQIATDGKTAIGRTWGAYAAVAVINSELGGHISTTGWDGSSSRNLRYVKMNADPDAETVKFVEYNNTGAGAITEAVVGCTILTEAEAANYSNQKVIFATTNGKVTYKTSWAGTIASDATVVIKDAEGNTVATTNGYSDTALTENEWNALVDQIVVPTGKKIDKYYSDEACTTEYVAGNLVAGENTIYVTFKSAGNTGQVTYDEVTADVDGWTVTMASAGSSKIANTIGDPCNTDTVPYTSCDKLATDTGDNLLSETFTAVNTATVQIIGGTTSTGNAFGVKVEALDAEGNVVATVEGTGPAGKVTGYITDAEGNNYLTINSDTRFVQVRISCTTAGKNFCVLSATVEYVLPAQEHTYNFSLEELIAAYGATAPADKTNIESQHLTGSNSFLTLAGEASNKCVVRAGNNCIEIKDAQLNVTFQGTGTITIAFASTGGSNESRFSLLDASGNALVATETTATAVAGSTGEYSVTGTTYVTVTYTITEAGTYTISMPSGVVGRGGRINAITMVDNF